MLKIGSIIRDQYGQRFTCTSIRKYNHNHDEHGRFTFGPGVGVELLPFEPIPKPGTTKDQVYQTYIKYGQDAALEHARALGIAYRTPATWTNRWKAQGIQPGTEKGFVLPPELRGGLKPVPPTAKPKIPPPTTRPDDGHHRVHVRDLSGNITHVAAVQKGLNAIPAEHQSRLAKFGVNVVAAKTTGLKGALGAYWSWSPGGPGTVASKTVKVGDYVKGWGSTMKVKDVSGVTVHELGHGMDHLSNWEYGRAIKTQVDNDAKAMTQNDKDYARYFFTNEKERFAELYRAAYSPGATAFGMQTERARRIFANSISIMKGMVG